MTATRVLLVALALSAVACTTGAAQSSPSSTPKELHLGVKKWQILERESGPVNYYEVVADPEMPFIRAHYKPPVQTAILAYMVDDADRPRVRGLRWKWRVHNFPPGGDECIVAKGDSAAGVFVVWKRGMRESGGELNVWRSEELDLKAEFRKHFEDGDPNADVPDFMGVGIMTDGDQTNTEIVADYADFVLLR